MSSDVDYNADKAQPSSTKLSNQNHTALQFPPDFIFGVATAAYQIEGAVSEDGRGPSIWDTFSHAKGRVKNGDTGDIACDHYHRWESDLDIIQSLGVDAYRFSIAWPRLFPKGNNTLNPAGIGFYDRLLDGCAKRGIKAFVTLYHWDLPQAAEDNGGWSNRSTADHFAHYASTVTRLLGDRMETISTFNEPWCSSMLGNLHGVHAPGNRNLETALNVIHGQHRAHGLAVQSIRAENSKLPVGIVLNPLAIKPATQDNEDIEAAARHEAFNNGVFFAPLFNGQYPEKIVAELGNRLPNGWQSDMSTIKQPLDFWGLNYYTPEYIGNSTGADSQFPATRKVSRPNVPRTDIGWEIDANAMLDMLRHLYATYTLPTCYVTENGAAYNQGLVNGVVDDQDRIDYLHAHLLTVCDALAQEVPVAGYFGWSLMDNFEWAEGYDMRFGLVHVNYQTQQRTLKRSAEWYRDVVSAHATSRTGSNT